MGQIAGAFRRRVETWLWRAMDGDIPRPRSLPMFWLLGCVALAITTAVCFLLGRNAGTVALVYLIIIVLLSLLDSFVSSAIFSIVAVACINFFFAEPIFSFEVAETGDVLTVIAFFFTSLVITGLVRRMRALADAHRGKAQLLDLTHDAVFVRDVDDRITYWNRGAEELYGWKWKEAVGRTTHDLLQTEFPVPLDEIMQVLVAAERWEGELVHATREGTQISVATRWSLQRDPNGRPSGVLAINTDITLRKRADEELRTQAAYLAEAQRLSATGSFGWNASSGEIFWSEESFRIFGYDPAMRPSIEAVIERVHPEDVCLVKGVIERAEKEKREFDFEHRLQMPDGSIKHLHVVAHVMADEPGNLQFAGAVMDITTAERAQEQLQQAQAELAYVTRVTTLGELTASIAHEVNQPLAAIATNAEASLRFLVRDPPQLDEVRSALNRMIGDSKRAAAIVQHIRALAKKTKSQPVGLDLNAIVDESASLLQREVTSHRVALRRELAPGLPAILGDRVQLQQVMINLIINGLQAMAGVEDRARELVIRSLQDEAGQVLVSVQDSGVGIGRENASRLFDAFFTTKPDGMGMGLSICRTIIEAHGGRVWAAANSGPGATFQFSLPSIRGGAP